MTLMNTGSGFFGDEAGDRGEPPHGVAPGGEDEGTFADVLNGFSFTGRGRRKRGWRGEDVAARDQGAGASQEHPSTWVEPARTEQRAADQSEAARAGGWPGEFEALGAAEVTGFVRPYAITGGRTKWNHALELETLISTNHVGGTLTVPDNMEHRSIVEECQTPRSVAEIAALLRVPLGVARVLISDMADAGLVTVHKTISGSDGAEAHFTLMERVLSGLRRL